MKKILPIILVFVMFLSLPSRAGNQKIIMKDKSVFYGYISEQNFKTPSQSIISYTQCERIFDRKVTSEMKVTKKLSEWPDQWREWAEKNGYSRTEGGDKYLTLSEVRVSGDSQESPAYYHISQSGTDFFTAVKVTPGIVRVNLSEVSCITNDKRDKTLLNDVNDIVETKSSVYKGVIVENYPGKQLKIWDEQERMIYVVNQSDIVSLGCEGINNDFTIWQQCPYLVTIMTDDSTSEEGILLKNSIYSGGDLVILTRSGREIKYSKEQYMKIRKLVRMSNPDAEPVYDIILSQGEARLNRESELQFTEVLVDNTNPNLPFYYVLKNDKEGNEIKFPIVNDTHVVIEANLPEFSDVYVCKAQEGTMKGTSKNEPNKPALAYTEADLFRATIKVQKSVSVNNTVKFEFNLEKEKYGYYFIYLRGLDKCWLIQYPSQN